MEKKIVKKSSWHFKLLAWARGTRSMLPRSQCSYTWMVITSMLFSPVILFAKIGSKFFEFEDQTGLQNTIHNGLWSIFVTSLALIAFAALPAASILDPGFPLWLGFFFYHFIVLMILIFAIVWSVVEYIDHFSNGLEKPETPQYKFIDALKGLWNKVCKPVTYK